MEERVLEVSDVQFQDGGGEVSHRETRRDKKKLGWTIFSTCLVIGVWAGILYMVYLQANTYMSNMKEEMNSEIHQVKIHNLQELEELKEGIVKVQSEMEAIKNELASTGKAVDGTDKTGQALQEQVSSLNQQLSELKGSLNKLEDAARAY